MTPRQRVITAVKHQMPDRLPLFYRDEPDVEKRLLADLGLSDREALLRHFEIDFRWVEPDYVGPPLFDESTGLRRDIWGVTYAYVKATHGGNWEPIAHPLQDVEDPAALEDYHWPKLEWYDFSSMTRQIEAYEDYAIMTCPGVASPTVLGTMQHLLGSERAWTDALVNPEFFQKLVEKMLAFVVPFVDRMLSAANGRVDFFRIGDDFGTQRSLIMSPGQFREHFAPILKTLSAVAKRNGTMYYHHSCGAIRELIPDLIEIGADVIDPLQIQATGMDPMVIKEQFGDQVCFSGGIDQQQILPNGTPEEVRREVHRMCDIMAPGGGYFVGPTHNFQADIPTQNIVAMYEAAREWHA